MNEACPAVLMSPLRGEWMALRTPAHRIPSHGTEFLGQGYAFDFVKLSDDDSAPLGPRRWRMAYTLVPCQDFASWNAPVYAAESGTVAAAMDGCPDRRWVNGLWEFCRVGLLRRIRPPRITHTDWRPLTGNFVVIQGASGAALYAHLRCGTVAVATGDTVAAGEQLGRVGNSGNSTMPHLHFHLMDRAAGIGARGLPCEFDHFQRWTGVNWEDMHHSVPRRRDRLLFG